MGKFDLVYKLYYILLWWTLIDSFVQNYFRLEDGASEPYARFVFHNAARRRTKDSFSEARIKAVTVYFKTKLWKPMTNKRAKKIHLSKEECLQSYVDWVCVDQEEQMQQMQQQMQYLMMAQVISYVVT